MKTRKCRPIYIGVFSAPIILSAIDRAPSYLYASYLTWISLSGAIPVVIPFNLHPKELSAVLRNVNGVVFPGGAIENTRTHTYDQYKMLIKNYRHTFNFAVRETKKGNPFPIWGTCLGFEILGMLGENRHRNFFIRDHLQRARKFESAPLTFTGPSRIKSAFSPLMRQQIAKTPVSRHLHNFGYDLAAEHTNRITTYLRIVSTDETALHTTFVNMFEYIDYPFYGSLWHPEKPVNKLSEEVGAILSKFLKRECEKNKNVCSPTTISMEVLLR